MLRLIFINFFFSPWGIPLLYSSSLITEQAFSLWEGSGFSEWFLPSFSCHSAASFWEASSSPRIPLVPCPALSGICEHPLRPMEKRVSEAKHPPSQLPESVVSPSSPYWTFRNPLKVWLKPPYCLLRESYFNFVLCSQEALITVCPSRFFLCFYVKLIDYPVTLDF